jgi:hypothetical protein
MQKLAIASLVAISLLLASRPAEAGCGGPCPTWVNVLGFGLATGIVVGYAVGTGYFIYHDATDEQQSLDYLGTEAGVNAALGGLFGGITFEAAKNRRPVMTAAFGALTIVHGTLAVRGFAGVVERRGELYLSDEVWAGIGAIAASTHAILWASQIGKPHGRAFGIAEAAVNLPLAAGLGYLAYDRGRDHDMKPALALGAFAAISGALAFHGVRTAISPTLKPSLAVLGSDLMPTIVSVGTERAVGLGAAGTW